MAVTLFSNLRGCRHRTASGCQSCFLLSVKTGQTIPDVHLIDNGVVFTNQFRVLSIILMLLLIISHYLLNISTASSASCTSSVTRELSHSIFIFQGYFKTLVWINLTVLRHYFLARTKVAIFKDIRLAGTYCCTLPYKRFASAIKKTLQMCLGRNLRLLILFHIISNIPQGLLLFLAEQG